MVTVRRFADPGVVRSLPAIGSGAVGVDHITRWNWVHEGMGS